MSIELRVADATVTEGDLGTSSRSLAVSLSSASDQPITVDFDTADGSAIAGSDYAAASGTLTFPAGQTVAAINLPVIGDTDVEADETVMLSFSNPVNADLVDNQAVIIIRDDDGATTPAITISNATVVEGNGGSADVTLTVSLSQSSAQNVSVGFATANGSAAAGSDYSGTSGTLIFTPGETSRQISIPVTGDTTDETNETVLVNLGNPVNATVADAQGVLTIEDDDGTALPTMSIADVSITEGNAGTTTALVTVSLSTTSNQAVTAAWSTASGTATAITDYVGASSTVTFNAGETTRQISVVIVGDTADEPNETVPINLANPSNATLGDSQATLTIVDDDNPALPALSIADATVTEGNSGTTTAVVTVSLSAASAQTVTANWSTASGTATAISDYVGATGTVNFTAGQTTRQITIDIVTDTTEESDETVLVNLSSPSSATLQDSQATLTIVDDDGSSFGLDVRPDNPDCVAPSRGSGATGVAAVDAFPAAPAFSQPTKILQAPGDPSRWFVLEQAGRIRVFSTSNPGSVTTYLDLSSRVNEANSGGLLGLAFHPDFPSTPEIFVSYTGTGTSQESRISRFILNSATTPSLGSSTEQILLTADQSSGTHKGGDIAFGPDNALYVSIGDSSANNDPNDRGQNTTRLAGKMLRIDVIGTGPAYTIPAGNPFAGNAQCGPTSNAASCPEIYAWGFRNPWRWSFDPQTGDLWLGDVGEKDREEIDVVELGGNYGWSCREGTTEFNSARCTGRGPFIDPEYEYVYGSDGNQSVTGGAMYRGSDIAFLAGRYVFADFESGRIWALQGSPGSYTAEQLLDTPYGVVAFAQGEDGELYFVDYNAGNIHRLAATGGGGGGTDPVPDDLAATGCINPASPTQPSAGLVPYSINAPFWSDGAVKNRYIGLPNGGAISRNGGDWTFPNGTVLMKTFQLGGQLIETRLFMLHPDGQWAGYTYEWNTAQTVATRVRGGKTKSIGGQTWIYPSESQCLTCHTAAAGFSLGLETQQLNRTQFYPSTGRTSDQLHTLDHIGMFTQALPATVTQIIADPSDTSQPLDDRARAYLHTNCAGCHRPGGPTTSSMDLLVGTVFGATNTCDVVPATTDLGIANARLIAPGDAARSVLIARMGRRDVDGMPPLGSTVVDSAGEALLVSWANSLSGCQ